MNTRTMDSPFLGMLGVELVELRQDWCVLELEVHPRHCNRRGTLHGGMISALLDAGCVYAAITLNDESALAGGATVMLSINFTSEAQSGTRIRVEALVERRGRGCRRRFKSEPPGRPNIEPGVEADVEMVGCG